MNARGFNTISINSGLYIPWNIPSASAIYFCYWFELWFPWLCFSPESVTEIFLFYWQKLLMTFDILMTLFLAFICYYSYSLNSILLLKLFMGHGSFQGWWSWLCLEFVSSVLDLLLCSKVQYLWKLWLYFPVCGSNLIAWLGFQWLTASFS